MNCEMRSRGLVALALFSVFLAVPLEAKAQTVLQGSGSDGKVRMLPSDWAILELREPRNDLACTVTPAKTAALGFDMRFHAGYEVSIPLKELAGSDNVLTMLFRVTPETRKDEPNYFVQRVRVPEIEQDAGGNAYLQGAFDTGEGRYHVDWLMRDRTDRVCSSYWDVDAILAAKDKQLAVVLAPGAVEAADSQPFKDEPPVERTQGEPSLNVKILVNFAPPDAHSATLQPLDTLALVSILRTIAREPRIGKFSLIAFNLQEEKVVYRQENADQIDFPALGEALQGLHLGTVDLKRLSQKNGETEFLSSLIQQEVGSGSDHPDALIFAGPKALLDENVSRDSLKDVGEVEYPVFYMNYNSQPQAVPWRDSIGRAVKFFRGYEFTITRPRDLWAAMSDMVAKIVKFRSTRRTAGVATQ